MTAPIEIIRVGSDNNLFQVGNGEKFALVAFPGGGPQRRLEQLRQPQVERYLLVWLELQGVFNGSQKPPRLDWTEIEAGAGMAA
ncbi:hypothetical protein GXW78_17515 [Roseomonas terrae]|uniref:Uncharacterized protein n=1 Tax=Neoroseomonas terrae TaxID=424799 RepID=A0ABS5EKE5_9PROT|nr:hypothetical protein [Neoroseomonas terrae]MBR0651473.1 hypothetical protein [Neoroseomonas terrae]